MKIVVLDGYTENPGDLSWDGLAALGDLTVYDRTDVHNEDEIIRRIGDAEIVYSNKTPISKAVLDACPNIRFLSVLATGYNVIDYTYAREKGIPVTNIPGYSTNAVGEHTFAFLLEIARNVGLHSQTVHQGKWSANPDFCYWETPLMELAGKTMGIIGFGTIGRRVGAIARAFGMEVLATGSRETEEGRAIGTYVDLDTLLAKSDVISLHCPLFPETQGLINRDAIAKMKDGAILINTARGGVIVDQDVADALNSGKLRAAAMDVVTTEPIPADNPLLGAKNCFITPHIAWAALETRQRLMDRAVANLQAFLDGKPINVVN